MRANAWSDVRKVQDGNGVFALINMRARHSSARARDAISRALPGAELICSHDIEDARERIVDFDSSRFDLLLSGGGDGTVVGLINLLHEAGNDLAAIPPIGVLRLGTGNGLANVLGAGSLRSMLPSLGAMRLPPPTQRYDLVEVEGLRATFAGTGWDARLINDFSANRDAHSSPLGRRVHGGLAGYLWALVTKTVPDEYRVLRSDGQAHIEVINTGSPAFTLDPNGVVVPVPGGETGAVLYRGPVSVASCATSEEWGFGFRAHPSARKLPGYINCRIYTEPVLTAVRNMRKLWIGCHPQPGMIDWFVQSVKFRFSRPVPFQIGGDARGTREEIDFRIAPERLDLVDWRAAFVA